MITFRSQAVAVLLLCVLLFVQQDCSVDAKNSDEIYHATSRYNETYCGLPEWWSPVLAECTEELKAAKANIRTNTTPQIYDHRGYWVAKMPDMANHPHAEYAERIEQCGNRYTVSNNNNFRGIIHDFMKCDANTSVNDYTHQTLPACDPISPVAWFDDRSNDPAFDGVHVYCLHMSNYPESRIEVSRCTNAEGTELYFINVAVFDEGSDPLILVKGEEPAPVVDYWGCCQEGSLPEFPGVEVAGALDDTTPEPATGGGTSSPNTTSGTSGAGPIWFSPEFWLVFMALYHVFLM